MTYSLCCADGGLFCVGNRMNAKREWLIGDLFPRASNEMLDSRCQKNEMLILSPLPGGCSRKWLLEVKCCGDTPDQRVKKEKKMLKEINPELHPCVHTTEPWAIACNSREPFALCAWQNRCWVANQEPACKTANQGMSLLKLTFRCI